jgi:hypothetical protein
MRQDPPAARTAETKAPASTGVGLLDARIGPS